MLLIFKLTHPISTNIKSKKPMLLLYDSQYKKTSPQDTNNKSVDSNNQINQLENIGI